MAKRWWQFGMPEKWPPADVEEWLLVRSRLDQAALAECQDIFLDLKLRGDDCVEFLEEFSDLFDVDMKQFDWTKYFYSEAEEMDYFGFWRQLYRLFRNRWPKATRSIYPISADHLIEVAVRKMWFDQEPLPSPR
jgi:hypothetical protein